MNKVGIDPLEEIADLNEENELDYVPIDRRRSSKIEGESRAVKELKHLSFETISSIQFCIDGAIGLPVCSTATRITARLLTADRSQVGDPSPPTFCDLDSETFNPIYDLNMSWRGKRFLTF
jgi:hypothetical protein